jgi:hypothetical protein
LPELITSSAEHYDAIHPIANDVSGSVGVILSAPL